MDCFTGVVGGVNVDSVVIVLQVVYAVNDVTGDDIRKGGGIISAGVGRGVQSPRTSSQERRQII